MFKSQKAKDSEMTMVVLDALVSLLDKKQIVTRKEIQDEIILRAENDIVTVGGIEYKIEHDN